MVLEIVLFVCFTCIISTLACILYKKMEVNSSSIQLSNKSDDSLAMAESSNDVMDLSDDFIRRPVTPPNNISPGLFVNGSPMFAPTSQSPLNKRLNKLLIDSPIPSKRLEFCNTYTSTPAPSTIMRRRKRSISTCPPIRNKFHQISSFRCSTMENCKPKSMKTTVMEYINPFSPDGRIIALQKASQSSTSEASLRKLILNDSIESDESINSEISVRRPRLNEINVERYNQEFVELEEIGKGVHGSVFKCINRMNGCVYAIKRSNKQIVNTSFERIVRNEVYAHGILEHQNLVKNYSSWTENGFVYIQNEYCNGGSLRDYTEEHVFTEKEARILLYQIALGLCYIHEKGLAHMDIKPDNILLHDNGRTENLLNNNLAGTSATKTTDKDNQLVYKLGDFGHVVPLGDLSVEDGDCRYLSNEIIQDNYAHLDKADIFSLGLTIYEVISRHPLPKNGDEWQFIRSEGHLKYLDNYSADLNDLLRLMIKPDPVERPSAPTICNMLRPLISKSPKHDHELFDYLQQINNNVNVLQHKVDFSAKYSKVVCRFISDKWGNNVKRPTGKGRLLIGKKQQRSYSTTTF